MAINIEKNINILKRLFSSAKYQVGKNGQLLVQKCCRKMSKVTGTILELKMSHF